MSSFTKEIRRQLYHFGIEQHVVNLNRGDTNVDPSYQRGLVWTQEQKEKLIDSVFWGIELPAIYYRELPILAKGFWLEVVDGKQRLCTLRDFMDDKFSFNGYLFSQLSNSDQWRFKRTVVPAIHVSNLTDEDTIELYNRLNFCGVPHRRPNLDQEVDSIMKEAYNAADGNFDHTDWRALVMDMTRAMENLIEELSQLRDKEVDNEDDESQSEVFMQQCNSCGEKFQIRYWPSGTYNYVTIPCECASTHSPVDGAPSISQWLLERESKK